MVAHCTKVSGSLLSNIKQATSQVVSREVSSRMSAFTSHRIRYFSCPLTRTVLMVCVGNFSGASLSLASCVDSRNSFWAQSSLWCPSCSLEFPGRGWSLHNSHPKSVAEESLQEGRLAHTSGSQHLTHEDAALCLPFLLVQSLLTGNCKDELT